MNKRMMSVLVQVVILMLFAVTGLYPCTTFVLHQGNRLVFGRNLDWPTGTGLVMVNPRNLEKVALVDPSEKPANWVSKFGSITFNQVGRDRNGPDGSVLKLQPKDAYLQAKKLK